MTETEKNKELKFRAHESFYIRKGWLSKGMKNVAKKNRRNKNLLRRWHLRDL